MATTGFASWLVGDRLLDECEDEDERLIRRTLSVAWVVVSMITPVWGVIYIIFDEVVGGLIPIVYGFFTFVSFAAMRRWGGWNFWRKSQMIQHLLLPFFLMWELGGFGASSAVLIWSLLAPISSMWAGQAREALSVLLGFVALTVFSAIIESSLSPNNGIPEWAVTAFYAANFVTITTIIFLLLAYLVGQQSQALDVMRRNRELETAYLQQEVSLRQSDKLATLGKLSAGMAHELNNPAAAVQQATNELSNLLLGDDEVRADLAGLGLSESQDAQVWELASRIGARVDHPEFLDPLERSDREDATQDLLEAAGVDDAWELAPSLVSLGLEPIDLERLRDSFPAEKFGQAANLLARQFHRQTLLGSLDESTGRIVSMVRALKSYSYLDQAPSQLLDVHEGLDSTLVMFQNRLRSGIEVRKFYGDIPEIEGHGSELNQVWTNLLDNALDAMGDTGTITLSTHQKGDDVIIEVEDDGPGVPADMIETIFDPFVTSKAPGDGTGLGLNIAHSIITQKHGGQISLSSRPGRTAFRIQLPATQPKEVHAHETNGREKE